MQYTDAGENFRDIALKDYDSEVIAEIIVKNIATKGFCTIDAGIDKDMLTNVFDDIGNIENEHRFYQPPALLYDGLLGGTGSTRIAHLQKPNNHDDNFGNGEHIDVLDGLMSELGECLSPSVGQIGFSMHARTPAILHESGQEPREQKEMTEAEASEWMVQLIRAKLMCLVILGPNSGTLHLKPFDNTEILTIETTPGEIILLRADALYHRHVCHSTCLVLSCFFVGDTSLSSKHTVVNDMHLTPVAKALYDWVDVRLGVLKSKEEADAELPAVPESWVKAMSHAYFTGQRHIVQDVVVRAASTWNVDGWLASLSVGPDYVGEVPIMRWDNELWYKDVPEGWKACKTHCKHGSFADGLDLFDNKCFNLSPAESKGMDPHDRWTLEGGYEVLLKAQYKRKDLLGSYGGVYTTCGQSEFRQVGEISGMGGGCIVANRFSFCLGMKGPSYNTDVDGASGLMIVNQACQGMSERGTAVQVPFCLCGGITLLFSPHTFFQRESFGVLSKVGRCFTFDHSADGSVLGDAGGYLAMKPRTESDDDAQVFGTVCGTGVNHTGRVGFGAPSGPALLDIMDLSLKKARIEAMDLDVVDCHGSGVYHHDAIEVSAIMKAMNPEDVPTMYGMCGLMANSSNSNNAYGVLLVIKAMNGLRWSLMKPIIHVLALNPHCSEDSTNMLIATESLELRARYAYSAAVGYGFGGTNSCAVLWGKLDERVHYADAPKLSPGEKITFWPAGGGGLDPSLTPRRDYYIAGTMTNWEPKVMRPKVAGSHFTYTMALGENRWEKFQIWLDGDDTRRLHPGDGPLSCIGPEDVDYSSCWWIDGRPGKPPDDGHEEITTPDTGLIGTKFTISLRISGKYRIVDWSRVVPTEKEREAIESAASKGSEAAYFIHRAWDGEGLEQMHKDDAIQGRFFFDLKLPASMSAFQIVKDRDWDQVVYPAVLNSGPEERVCGPDHYSDYRYWLLRGYPGQVFRISFTRTSECGVDKMRISWQQVTVDALSEG